MFSSLNNITHYQFLLNDDCYVTKVKGEYYLQRKNFRLKMNSIGARVIEALNQRRTVQNIIEDLSLQYKKTKTGIIANDLNLFFKNLYRNDIISVRKNGKIVKCPEWYNITISNVYISLCSTCNLRCKHCYITDYNKNDMSFEDIKYLFEQLFSCGVKRINFSGGEILVRNDVLKIFKLASTLGFEYGFTTNGTLITKNLISCLKDYPPTNVNVSLYGHKADLHESITNSKCSFDKTTCAIKLLTSSGFNVNAKVMVTNQNYKYIEQIYNFLINLGTNIVSFDPNIYCKDNGDQTPWKYRISEQDLMIFDKSKFGRKKTYKQRKPNSLICNAGVDQIAIDSDGTVFPCSVFKLPIGNIKTSSLTSILATSKCLKEFFNFRVKNLPTECRVCKGLPYCKICPGMSYTEHNSYTKKFEFECKRTKLSLNIEN